MPVLSLTQVGPSQSIKSRQWVKRSKSTIDPVHHYHGTPVILASPSYRLTSNACITTAQKYQTLSYCYDTQPHPMNLCSHLPASNCMPQLPAQYSSNLPFSKTLNNQHLLVLHMRINWQVGYVIVRQCRKAGQQVWVWGHHLQVCHCLSHTSVHP